MSRASDTEDDVKQRSGWIIPIAVFIVTAGLSALFLLYYLVPAPTSFIEEHAAPTSREDPVSLTVNGSKFMIPANYIMFARARQGGALKEVQLFTTFPEFNGYSDWHASSFSGNAADSPVIFILLREEQFKISEAERLQRIYMTYVLDPAGKPGPFGLTQYVFRDDSGYHGEDLFVGQDAGKPVVLRCVRFSQQVPSPSCLRDERLTSGVSLSYRFKRANLGHWLEIATGIDKLIASFHVK
ncbi:MAG TPA: hypothetical protein VLT91_13625 [Rhizomicrobium sp.]|nr:hypothetical protein [Rhizomicrobium sp.]